MSYQAFKNALVWNSVNVLLYKFILQAHQACLFYIVSKELFGISGTLFSMIYLLISLTNFGFDYSLFAFHRFYIQSQTHFKILMHQCFIRLIILCCMSLIILFALHHFAYLPQISFIMQYVSSGLLALLVAILISESLKKTLELFAHLSFLNKTITIVDIATLTSYILILWTSYFVRGYIDLYAIFIPMCITSWAELCIIIKRLFTFYQTLPKDLTDHQNLNTKTILINQSVNYINQIAKALFSPNFIIIFLAYHLGMVKAGYIKLIIDIIIVLYMLFNRAVGIPSAALMSQASSMQQSLMPDFKNTFLQITNGYIQFLYTLACLLIFSIGPCLAQSTCLSSPIIINILFFTFAGFLEYIIITYEKLFLTQKSAGTLAFLNGFSLIFLIPFLYFSSNLPPTYILLPVVIIRLCTIIAIAATAQRIWQIFPVFSMTLQTALISGFMASCLSIWHIFTILA